MKLLDKRTTKYNIYRLVDNPDKIKSEEYWEVIMKLVTTINKVGEQKNIEQDQDIEESIRKKR